MTDARIARCKATRLRCRSSVGDDPARLDPPHPWLIATAEPPLDALSLLQLSPSILTPVGPAQSCLANPPSQPAPRRQKML